MLKKGKNRSAYRRQRIKMRIRKVVSGTPEVPRMSVFRSNKDIYVQLIDDKNAVSLLGVSSKTKGISEQKVSKTEKSVLVGKLIAERAIEMNIQSVVFDRNGYLYHGRVKALADSARNSGLKF